MRGGLYLRMAQIVMVDEAGAWHSKVLDETPISKAIQYALRQGEALQ